MTIIYFYVREFSLRKGLDQYNGGGTAYYCPAKLAIQ